MKAVILAGGKATRLYPVTLYMPKQLMMINGYPAIHYILNHCKKAGIKDFILCISDNALKNHFFNALGDGSSLGIRITYSVDSEVTGTSGRVLSAGKKFLKDENDFLVYYGDIITDFKLSNMIASHKRKNSICTIATSSDKVLEFGICNLKKDRTDVARFIERPIISQISESLVNCGIAVCNSRVLGYCKKADDFFGDTLPKILDDDLKVDSFDIKCEFYDIGSYSIIEWVLAYLKKKPELATLDAIRSKSVRKRRKVS